MAEEKIITFIVPCFNSADYMDNCIRHLIDLNTVEDDIEIIIIDDGSDKDDTLKKAQGWYDKYPTTIRVIHQENGGHGAAVNTGLKNASGLYFKVVDSDDYLDTKGSAPVMDYIRKQSKNTNNGKLITDLIIANYVYNKEIQNKITSINYTSTLPQDCQFTWDDIKKFNLFKYIQMHSMIFRTGLLRDINLELPKHCFYVDSIFSLYPLPYVKSIYYINTNMYMYYIGRVGQSVEERVIHSREDQMINVTKTMIDLVDVEKLKTMPKLEHYTYHYIAMMMAVCTIILRKKKSKEMESKRKELLSYMKNRDKYLYKSVHRFPMCKYTNLPTSIGRTICLTGYEIGKKLVPFT